eukprot:gene4151-5192_t
MEIQGLKMDDLDNLLADLGRPKSGMKTTGSNGKSIDTSDIHKEIQSIMDELDPQPSKPTVVPSASISVSATTSVQDPVIHHHHHHHHTAPPPTTTNNKFDAADDLDELMESLNSSISTALKTTGPSSDELVAPKPTPVPAPVVSKPAPAIVSSANNNNNNNGAVKVTSTATIQKKPAAQAPVLATTTVSHPAPPQSKPAPVPAVSASVQLQHQPSASFNTDDLDELLKNLNPQTPVVVPPPSNIQSQKVSINNSNNNQGGFNSAASISHTPTSSTSFNSNNNNNTNNNANKPKVLQGDDLDNLLSNLTDQMGDIDKSGPTSRGTCGGCRKPIFGETIQAMGKFFHPEHFTCHNCQTPLGTRNFYEQEGIPHCEKCYQELFCARCAHCDDPITDRCINALGKKWHINHFVCTQCLKPFEGGVFFERDGRPYCEADFFSTFAARCGGCNQPIRGECINALGTQWHPEHFVCQYCQKSFSGGTFYEFGGKPYCDIHYHQQAGSICSGCGKAVSGRCVDALDKKWHPEHFVCAFCMNPLAGGSYTANNGKPYCKVCHSKLFG